METTPRYRMAFNHAKESLSGFGHSQMSSAHLILGLLRLGNGIPYHVLGKAGLSVQSVENYLSARRDSAEESANVEGVRLGKSVLSAIERAEVEARARQHTYSGTDHLLLGILAEEDGASSDLLCSVHIDGKKLRRSVEEEIQ